jgi:hypothetical protein
LESNIKKEGKFQAPKMAPMGTIRNLQKTAAKILLASGC